MGSVQASASLAGGVEGLRRDAKELQAEMAGNREAAEDTASDAVRLEFLADRAVTSAGYDWRMAVAALAACRCGVIRCRMAMTWPCGSARSAHFKISAGNLRSQGPPAHLDRSFVDGINTSQTVDGSGPVSQGRMSSRDSSWDWTRSSAGEDSEDCGKSPSRDAPQS